MLLHRRRAPILDAVERLVGIQVRCRGDPHFGLWSWLGSLPPEGLAEPIGHRRAVHMPFLRATLHLVTTRDAVTLRPVIEPLLQRTLHSQSPFGKRLAGLNVDELMAVDTELLEGAVAHPCRARAATRRALADHHARRPANHRIIVTKRDEERPLCPSLAAATATFSTRDRSAVIGALTESCQSFR